jgi:hypothetical protein
LVVALNAAAVVRVEPEEMLAGTVQPVNVESVVPVQATRLLFTQNVPGAKSAVEFTVMVLLLPVETVLPLVVAVTVTESTVAVIVLPLGMLALLTVQPVKVVAVRAVHPVTVAALLSTASVAGGRKYAGTLFVPTVMVRFVPDEVEALVLTVTSPGDRAIGGCAASTGPYAVPLSGGVVFQLPSRSTGAVAVTVGSNVMSAGTSESRIRRLTWLK